jgi:hypothetical protein
MVIGIFASALIAWFLWKSIGLTVLVGLLVGLFVFVVDLMAKRGISTRFVKADDDSEEENERIEQDFFNSAKKSLKKDNKSET